MSDFINHEIDIAAYFSRGGKIVELDEWIAFWDSLNPYERLYFRYVPLN